MRTTAQAVAASALALAAGVAVPLRPSAAIALVGLVGVAFVLARPRRRRGRTRRRPTPQIVALVALWLALLSTLVFRARAADDLAANPLDGAGIYRVAVLTIAGVLAIAVIRQTGGPRSIPTPSRLYLLYILAVPLGAILAVNPPIVGFRFAEVSVFFAVWYATHQAFEGDQRVPLAHMRLFLLALVATLAVNVAAFPSAFVPVRGGIYPYRLEGVVPAMSANSVGFFGVVLLCFGLADKRLRGASIAAGFALVALSQYRTGYVAVAAVLLAWLVAVRSPVARLGLLVAPFGAWWAFSRGYFTTILSRGEQNELVATLNSRTDWWGAALETWERSPVFGTGLTSGTRFEALIGIGAEFTSTIHSTWVEALVGTGLVGASLLALSFVSALVYAVRSSGPGWRALPLMLLAALAIRSITGATFEMGTVFLPFYLAAAAVAWQGLHEQEGRVSPSERNESPRGGANRRAPAGTPQSGP